MSLIEKIKRLSRELQDTTNKLKEFEIKFENSSFEELPNLREELDSLENKAIFVIQQLLDCEKDLVEIT